MAAHGKSDATIAGALNMSVHTVDSHMRKIFRKLETNNRTMADRQGPDAGADPPLKYETS